MYGNSSKSLWEIGAGMMSQMANPLLIGASKFILRCSLEFSGVVSFEFKHRKRTRVFVLSEIFPIVII